MSLSLHWEAFYHGYLSALNKFYLRSHEEYKGNPLSHSAVVLAGKRREKGKQMISPTQQPTTAGNKRHLQHSKYSHKPAKPINYLIPNCTNKKLYEKLWLGSDDLIKPKRRQRLRFLYQCLNNDSSIDIGVMVLILW